MTVKSGILGKAKPNGAALLFRADPTSSISAVLSVANSGTGAAYSVGLKGYDQRLNLASGAHAFKPGFVISNYTFTSTTPIPVGATAGQKLEAAGALTDEAVFNRYIVPDFTSIFVKNISIRSFSCNQISGAISVGDTLTKGTGGDTSTCLVYEVTVDPGNSDNRIIQVGPETINGSGSTFADGDIVNATSGGNATILGGGISTANNEFVFSTTTAGGVYSTFISSVISFFSDRTYRFDTSDASMSGRDFKLSTTANGEYGPDGDAATAGDNGVEYAVGKTTNGTAGSGGAYSQYAFTPATTTSNLFFYDGTTGANAGAGWGGADRFLTLSTAYTYTEISVYNVTGAWANNTAFSFNSQGYTLQSKTTGSYGYVREWDPTGQNLDVILGTNSAGFAGTDTFNDAPDNIVDQTLATVSSVVTDSTAIGDDQYYVNTKDLAANATERITSLILGPGESIVVNSATQHNTFILNGFSETSGEFTVGHST